eukprot:XP_001691127.1 predicted protein [Chlamydomonas reinhardtii]
MNGASGLDDLRSWGTAWNIPGHTNSDAIVGNQDAWTLQVRLATALEASPLLRRLHAELQQHLQQQPGKSSSSSSSSSSTHGTYASAAAGEGAGAAAAAAAAATAPSGTLWSSAFSRCTLPVVLLADWFFNFSEFFENAATAATYLLQRQGMLPGGSGGLRAVVCKLIGSPMPPLDTAAAVVRHVEASPHGLAEDPLGFYPRKPEAAVAATTTAAAAGAGAEALQPPPTLHEDTTLRVVFEARAGSTRNIRNLHQVMEACDKWGADFKAGPFTRIACRALATADTPDLHGGARLRHTMAAVRSAHVLVAMHGAGAANALFLRADGGGSAAGGLRAATALLEIHFHAYNLEDPAQCSPADWVLAIKAPGPGTPNTRHGMGHAMRDQHVTLQPEGLRAMLTHVASMLRDPEGYGRAREQGNLHGYALPTPGTEAVALEQTAAGDEEVPAPARGALCGVVLGPPGLAPVNMTEHLKGSPQWLLQPRSGR